ncbi:ABC-type dipeptide/oligopeptide/nickel transport system, permease component [Desulfosporosinus orientis DSM 765]|uniref:ABC-type dipeptide/oligopeptide/nickel transport system, permease component n=1 Tax=Desulfosporosinus orientis (strain ATCC 19365 / DSM 765 / NCIMB 8382 / VKM B-1628 / Singapore I) TaxID=768706 RepID=G7WFJ2_DESOD|nr:ABC transporter permease [Desulfosporosinus orientis]AET68435.1 ABC-type dipeptide/oligopeptide/nickel transport system, permease component [Desulfosporosinus orientis DSM 765]
MPDDRKQFVVVGADYRPHLPERKAPSLRDKLKGKPLLSMGILSIIVLGCIFAEQVYNHDPTGFYLQNLNEAPNGNFYFGTDSLGRDIFSMIWYGGRASILIGLLSTAIITVIGVIYGCISGSADSRVDAVMMRVPELINSIPIILLVLLLTSVMGKQNILKISFVIGVTGWCALARIVRSEVRQIRSSEYVLAAHCMGGSFLHIMARHLIPNFVSTIMFVVVSSISLSMSMESTLSFLGLGLPVDVISWGSMLSLANKALLSNTWWVIIIPGLFLIITLVCITNIAYFFRRETNKLESIL